MKSTRMIQDYWEHLDRNELLIAMIGQEYGSNPLTRDSDIRRDKEYLANLIFNRLKIDDSMIGIEIGSGCGYMTLLAAQRSQFVYALDISHSFLEQAKLHCASQKNINFQIIQSCSLSPIQDNSIDYIYSNNVFIHLNIYEITNYIKEAVRVLKPGGKLWFDFAEIDRCDILNDPQFLNTVNVRMQDPHNRSCLEYVSAVAIKNVLTAHGFEIAHWHEDGGCDTKVFSKKL